MSNSYKLFLVLVLVCFGFHVKSQDIINTEASLTDQNILQYLTVLKDSSKVLTIHDVLKKDQQVLFSSEYTLDPKNAYWGKLTFYNPLERAKSYYLFIGKNDKIDTYYTKKGNVIHHTKTGYLYPSDDKEVGYANYFSPIQIGPKSTLDLYIRIEEQVHNDPEFLLEISSEEEWASKMVNRYMTDFIFQALIWLVLCYNVFMYFSSKIKGYLIYAVYLFLTSLTFLFFTAVLREFIIDAVPQYTIYFVPIAILTASAHWFFAMNFLNIREKFQDLIGWVKGLIIGNLSLYFVTLIYIHFSQSIYWSTLIVQFGMLINALMIVGLIYKTYESKYEVVKYYIWGSISVALFIIFEVTFWNGDNSNGDFARLGILAEVIAFSMGLAYKKRVISLEKRKAIDKQIDQLKLNENLAQWQKEELEKIIDSRTEKIKSKNKTLKKAFKKAEEAARVKSDFLSVMSHEIRTPMNAVIGMIHLLLGDNPKKSQLENLNTLKFSAENLLVLINDILDYSKVESGKVSLENIAFDLRELTKGLGHSYEIKAQESGIYFNILIDQNIPASLKGDPARITQILNNLISNAIKFTPRGQVKLLIKLVNKTNGKVNLEFSVEDTGIGISKDKLDVIFDSFTQAHADTTRIYGGTGLGLAITKKLITLFESHIFVESTVGKGTKFSFSLQLEEAESGPINIDEDNSEKILSIKGKRVLIVDDNLINLMMAKKFIEKWGMRGDTVESGKQALTAVFNSDYDLILMDLQMPEMDGYETTETIRSLDSEDIKNVPIIAVSADTYDNVRTRIYDVGMNDFLSKPFSPNDLLNLVHKYCANTKSKNLK